MIHVTIEILFSRGKCANEKVNESKNKVPKVPSEGELSQYIVASSQNSCYDRQSTRCQGRAVRV